MEMCDVNSVPQEFDFHQIRRNLPNVVSRGNYGYSLPAEMFHQAFEQFFHLSVRTFGGRIDNHRVNVLLLTELYDSPDGFSGEFGKLPFRAFAFRRSRYGTYDVFYLFLGSVQVY